MYYNYGPMGGHNWGLGILMFVFFLIFIALITLIVVKLLSHNEMNYKSLSGERGHNDPLNIVKQRYAKGEIKKDEYEQLIKDLK
jgi:putative membrane protein